MATSYPLPAIKGLQALEKFDTPWATKCHAKGSRLDVAKLKYNPAQVLRFSNIPGKLTVSELESYCAAFGPVLMAHMSKQSTFDDIALGTVVMDRISDVKYIIKELNGAFCAYHELTVVTLTTELMEKEALSLRRPVDSKPLEAFTCFGKLPPELRIRIWKFSQPVGRIVQLELRNTGFRSRNKVPSILHVCKESRIEALKAYELAFAILGHPTSAVTYFDFDKDELYLSVPKKNIFPSYPDIIDHLREEDSARIKCLLLDILTPHRQWRQESTKNELTSLSSNWRHFTSIERIKLVCNKNLNLNSKGQANVDQIDFRQPLWMGECSPLSLSFQRLCQLVENSLHWPIVRGGTRKVIPIRIKRSCCGLRGMLHISPTRCWDSTRSPPRWRRS